MSIDLYYLKILKEILKIKKINFFKLSQNIKNEEFLDYHSFPNLIDFGDKSLLKYLKL
jgi:hypothetical protein